MRRKLQKRLEPNRSKRNTRGKEEQKKRREGWERGSKGEEKTSKKKRVTALGGKEMKNRRAGE